MEFTCWTTWVKHTRVTSIYAKCSAFTISGNSVRPSGPGRNGSRNARRQPSIIALSLRKARLPHLVRFTLVYDTSTQNGIGDRIKSNRDEYGIINRVENQIASQNFSKDGI